MDLTLWGDGLQHLVGILLHKFAPRLLPGLLLFGFQLTADVGVWIALYLMTGIGHGQGIGSVEVFRFVGIVDYSPQHRGHLLLRGVAVAGNRLLDGSRFIFRKGDVSAHGSRYGHPLGASQLKHRLDVLAEEGSLNGEMVGMIHIDEAERRVKYVSYAEIKLRDFLQIEHVHQHKRRLAILNREEAIAQNLGSWVDAEYNLLHITCDSSITR